MKKWKKSPSKLLTEAIGVSWLLTQGPLPPTVPLLPISPQGWDLGCTDEDSGRVPLGWVFVMGLRPQSQPLGLRTGPFSPPQAPGRQALHRKCQKGLASKGCVSLAGRIHLPGTRVTGLPEMINLLLPAASDQECLLPQGTSCAPAPNSPGTARTWPTLCSRPDPRGLGLISQPKGTCRSGMVGEIITDQSQEEKRGLEGRPPDY